MSGIVKVRFVELDIARSIAILIMIVANAAPAILEQESVHPVFRLICSLAAPLFIFISGLTFRVNVDNNKNGLLKNAFYLLASAAFVDLAVWRIIPFCTFDVLYLIAFSQIITFFIFKLSPNLRVVTFCVLAAVFLLTQQLLSYRFEIEDSSISDTTVLTDSFYNIQSNLKRLVFDGWFPILPWSLLFLSGSLISYQRLNNLFLDKKVTSVSAWILFVGVFSLFSANISQDIRNGYMEVFYPFSGWILVVAGFWMICALSIAKMFRENQVVINYIQVLGKKSLFVYILHLTVISYLFSGQAKMSAIDFSFVSVLFVAAIWVIVYLMSSERCKLVLDKYVPNFARKIIGV